MTTKAVNAAFGDGFREMAQRLEPVVVLSYGPPPAACQEWVEMVTYPTRWTNIRAARKEQKTNCLMP